MAQKGTCEYCMYYTYNEEYEYYQCEVNLDEDEMMRFLSGRHSGCPYFKFGDEYAIVKKQM